MVLTSDTKPDDTLYCIGAYILDALSKTANTDSVHVAELGELAKKLHGVSSTSFTLGMDWLYLLGALDMDRKGRVVRCL